MAFDLGAIVAHVKSDLSQFKKGMQDLKKESKSFGDSVNEAAGASRGLALGLAAVGAAATVFAVKSVQAFSESQNSLAQLNAVLKSTGGIAGVTAEQATELAKSLQKVTRFSDEAILGGENLLLTFTNISKDIFPQATEIMLDMSQALGQDLKSSAIQLGKALQDPILGVTALRRVGVNFNEAQVDVIKKLVETGRSAEAQALIMAELKKEFGGSAKAAGETFAGKLDILKNSLNDVQEEIGEMLVTAILPIVEGVQEWIDGMGGLQGILQKIKDSGVLEHLVQFLPAIAGAIAFALVPAVLAATAAFGAWLLTLAPFLIIGAGVGLALQLIADHFGGWGPLLKNVTEGLNVSADAVFRLWGALKQFWRDQMDRFSSFLAFFLALPFQIASALQNMVLQVRLKFVEMVNGIREALSGVKDAIIRPFREALDWVKNKVEETKRKLRELDPFKKSSPSLVELIDKGTMRIKDLYGNMFNAISEMSLGVRPVLMATAGAVSPDISQANTTQTTINGNINIGSQVDEDRFFQRLTRNQELAIKGIPSNPGTNG